MKSSRIPSGSKPILGVRPVSRAGALLPLAALVLFFPSCSQEEPKTPAAPSPVAEASPLPSVPPPPVLEKAPEPDDAEKLEALVKENSPVYFVKDTTRLLPGEDAKLGRILEALKDKNNVMLMFRGHTADFWLPQAQEALSFARAQRIRWWFENRMGEKITAVEVRGLGSREQVVKGDDEASRAKNRRVEIILQKVEP